MRQWRLIYDTPTPGWWNMAVDEAILRRGQPTLRFYRWIPNCLSLGYGQRVRDVDFERLRMLEWDAVRRPTGGRAILHTTELTYSLVLPIDHPIAAGSVVESYRRISCGLIEGLRCLGLVPIAEHLMGQHITNGPVCFETRSHYEIAVEGRKLVGSAQVRRRHALLQHGSLPLLGDIACICDVLAYETEADRAADKARVRACATTLADVMGGIPPSWADVAAAMAEGFARAFDIALTLETLTTSEHEAAESLITDVYANPVWLHRR